MMGVQLPMQLLLVTLKLPINLLESILVTCNQLSIYSFHSVLKGYSRPFKAFTVLDQHQSRQLRVETVFRNLF